MAYEINSQQMAQNKGTFTPNPAAKKGTEVAHTSKGPQAGSGKFEALKNKLASEKTKGGKKKVSNPGALAAYIGRQKYGNAAMARAAAQGRKRGV